MIAETVNRDTLLAADPIVIGAGTAFVPTDPTMATPAAVAFAAATVAAFVGAFQVGAGVG